MEVELSSMRDVLDAERRGAQDLREKMELELAERKLSSHRLQEELQCLSEQLEEARRAQAELEVKCKHLEQARGLEVEEKNGLAEEELPCGRAAPGAEQQQLEHSGPRSGPAAGHGAAAQGARGEQAQHLGGAGTQEPGDRWAAFSLALLL